MKKILIIEDEPAYIRLLQDQLMRYYTILSASNGQQGLAIARTEKPDLILLDIRMPVMDGLTVLQELRKDPYGKSAKVVLLTNLEPDVKVIPKITKDAPTYYFVKSDVELSSLLRKIEEILQK